MSKDFIPYEEALALEELGFAEDCVQFYNHHGTAEPDPKWDGKLRSNRGKWESFIDYDDCVGAPLYQQAFRWFRENYPDLDFGVGKIYNGNNTYHYHINLSWEYFEGTYEEAELVCLRKLIQIVKNETH